MSKKALITGITGQVGSFLAEYLVNKGYEVHGLDRRKSVLNHINIEKVKDKITLIEGDLTDTSCIYNIIDSGKYYEIYNLAAQSHVHTSFKEPQSTFNINTIGVLNILEGIRKHSQHTKLYQASTSELYGSSLPPQNELTMFHPRSPYAVSKLAAHALVQNYSEAYGLRCSCGIMFNTESPRRGDNFVTKKITNWIKSYLNACKNNDLDMFHALELGALDSRRDWSHAKDSVDAIYRICNQDIFFNGLHGNYWRTYAFGSGKAYTIREFLSTALSIAFELENFDERFKFRGTGLNEVLWDEISNRPVVKISSEFYRPSEVDFLQCDPTQIKKELDWKPKYSLHDIITDMLK